jgi:putative transposase
LLVDTLGLVWSLLIQPAHVQDAEGGKWVLWQARRAVKRLRAVFVDGAYRPAADWVARVCGWRLQVVAKPAGGFRPLPKRWVVERTFGWLGRSRRLSKDYERTPESSAAFVYTAMIHLMLKRLTC